MKESSTYQAIVAEGLREGREEEARAMVLLAGTERFGPPDDASRAAVRAIKDRAVLEGLMKRPFRVDSWAALIAGLLRPARRRGKGRQQSARG